MAIAFDAATKNSSTGTSQTFSHTVTGSDTFLWVAIFTQTNSSDVVTGVTYNSVALTRGDSQTITDGTYTVRGYIYYLASPDTGTHNVVISCSSSVLIRSESSSYTGVTGGYDTSSVQSQNTSDTGTHVFTFNLPSVSSSGAWAVLGAVNNQNTVVADTGSTLRTSGGAPYELYDSNGVVSGSVNMSVSVTSAGGAYYCGAAMGSMKTAASGPANVKTYKGVAAASVKTVKGVAIASVKTKKGVS